MGRRNEYALYSQDRDGNQHHFGNMGTSSIYVLEGNGSEIRFTDSGLPADMSHRICGPRRGTFVSESISASASTMFVIGSGGEMYTKMEDYDLNGGTAMFFDYTYRHERRPRERGTDVWTNWTRWSLPLEDWRRHADIPLSGRARLTRRITILQNGRGNAARELRVAGLDAEGMEGYYRKPIFGDRWEFRRERLDLDESDFLSMQPAARGLSFDTAYRGLIEYKGQQYWVDLPDFNLACTPSILRVHSADGQHADLILHHIEIWTYLKRNDPGLDGTPKLFYGTIDFDGATIPAGMAETVNEHFARYDR
jgi:hypothetical protein